MADSLGTNLNREIYNTNYVAEQLEFAPKTPYDARVLALRIELIQEHCADRDVLDLCCGSGAYVVKLLDRAKTIVGLDFSRRMLTALESRLLNLPTASKVASVEGDARSLPFDEGSFDTVFSMTSLYHVPNAEKSIYEVGRVLRPGGVAILELGNALSLATITSRLCHAYYGWAKPYHMRYADMLRAISNAGFAIEQHHAFQLLPMFGPKAIQLLLPFSLSLFKYPLGITVGGRLLDSVISGAPLLRRAAFRHLFVLRKI